MITPVNLVDAVQKFIGGKVQNYSLKTKDGPEKAPQVVSGFLPLKRSKESNDPDYPFVVIRLIKGKGSNFNADVQLKIVVGTYSEDSQGWRDTSSLLFRIWTELFKQRIIDNRYEIQDSMEFSLSEEQIYPHWIGELVTTWTIPHPIMEGLDG